MKICLSVSVCLFCMIVQSAGQLLPADTQKSASPGTEFSVPPLLPAPVLKPDQTSPDSESGGFTLNQFDPRSNNLLRLVSPEVERLKSELPSRPSALRLTIDSVQTTASRREFRISVLGMPSLDQAVDVWVSSDLKNWNKLEDSMIETGERGERKILMPLDSRMQFFRVSLLE